MATKIKTNKKPGKGGKIALGLFAILLLILIITACIGLINASLLRIRRAEVVLPDLPQGFDGKTILYASDIDIFGINTPARAGALFNQLQSLQPDILVLGGDYTSSSLLSKLNHSEGSDDNTANVMKSRSDFFHYINTFQAPLGKYGIASTEDIQWQSLREEMEENGITPLINERIDIHSNGDTLWLAGICGKISSLNDAGNTFSHNDCVLVFAEGPDVLPVLLTSEAADSGPWADLALCGHTHGGQIRLLGRSILSLSSTEKRFLSGWNTQSGTPILTSSGVGCEGVNMRLGTEPEVWLITLKRT
jgi:predicted MPP superfamily phosphohydrolase